MSPEEIAAAATVNAAWIALAAVLVGVVLTLIGGAVGARIPSRREHKKWVREQYDATLRMYTIIKSFQYNRVKMDRLADDEAMTPESPEVVALIERDDDLYNRVGDAMAPLAVIGPSEVAIAASQMQSALERGDAKSAQEAQSRLLAAARRALKVRR